MKSLTFLLLEQLLLERNERLFADYGTERGMQVFKGEHCEERQKERNVSDNEIKSAVRAARGQIKKLYTDGKLVRSRNGEDDHSGKITQICLVDTRKNKSNPTIIVLFLYGFSGRFDKDENGVAIWGDKAIPSFTIKTVFKKTEKDQPDFSGLMNPKKHAKIIYLY